MMKPLIVAPIPRAPCDVRTSLATAFSVFLIALLFGCDSKAPTVKPEEKPTVTVDEGQIDFGKVVVGQEVSHTYIIRNEGDKDLQLSDPEKLPASTPYEINAKVADRTIPPGKTTSVKLTIRVLGKTTKLYAGVTIGLNDEQGRSLRIGGKLVVEETLELRPYDIGQDFWKLKTDRDGRTKIFRGTLHSLNLPAFQILSTETEPADIGVTVHPLSEEELSKLDAKSGYSLLLDANSLKTVGRFSGKLTIKTDVEQSDPISIRLEGMKLDPLLFVNTQGGGWHRQQATIDLGTFQASSGKTATIDLHFRRPADGVMLSSKSCSASLAPLAVTFAPVSQPTGRANRIIRLRLSIPAGADPVFWNDRQPNLLTLLTNHPQAASIRLAVHAESK